MKVKFLTDLGYPSLVDCVGKIVEAKRLSAGAESGRISPDYTYYLSLSNLPERGGKGLEVVEE